jgi:predicted transcriptional regulator of viral defense system
MSSPPAPPGNERREITTMWAENVVRGIDREIAQLAERQHGMLTRRQLAALGLSQNAITARAAAGRLHRIHRGVYAVSHPILPATPAGWPPSSLPVLAPR